MKATYLLSQSPTNLSPLFGSREKSNKFHYPVALGDMVWIAQCIIKSLQFPINEGIGCGALEIEEVGVIQFKGHPG